MTNNFQALYLEFHHVQLLLHARHIYLNANICFSFSSLFWCNAITFVFQGQDVAAHMKSVLWTGVSRDTVARWPLRVEAWLVLKTETHAARGVGQRKKREIIDEASVKCAAGRGRTAPDSPPGATLTHSEDTTMLLSLIALPTSVFSLEMFL